MRKSPPPQPPPYRRLRAYTFDPSFGKQLDTALINETVLRVPWEDLKPGPVGEYLEVVDYDPASGHFYGPQVDLNDPHLLAQDGLAPSEGNPHFHQQMVYAVAMTTIANFEQALGRKALWAPHMTRCPETGAFLSSESVPKLRVYPHALREANAYYSPEKMALLFGYFPAILANPGENLPGGLVFTCLSQDVVAHETTHALLDGMHRYFTHDSNVDVLAFHEAFADIVALFQHFSQPGAIRDQIDKTRGDLASQNLLGELAHQFGQAIGNHGALRDAIGHFDEQKNTWVQQKPDPEAFLATSEPHARGAILVAAMFDVFLAVYKSRIADLLRIATGGSGVLTPGNLHPDLVNRLADEAARTARHVLRMAIRALDYCPPVDITFGEYLRALVTSDVDVVPDDERGYRIAVIEAFRRRGIYPRDVRTLSTEALRWQGMDIEAPDFKDLISHLKQARIAPRRHHGEVTREEQAEVDALNDALRTMDWQTTGTRSAIERLNHEYQKLTWSWFRVNLFDHQSGEVKDVYKTLEKGLGLSLGKNAPTTIYRSRDGLPSLEIHSVRSTRRPTQDGRMRLDLVVEMSQRRRGYFTAEAQQKADALPGDFQGWDDPKFKPDFLLRGGCTLLIDCESGDVRYCIVKSIRSQSRLARQRLYASGGARPRSVPHIARS